MASIYPRPLAFDIQKNILYSPYDLKKAIVRAIQPGNVVRVYSVVNYPSLWPRLLKGSFFPATVDDFRFELYRILDRKVKGTFSRPKMSLICLVEVSSSNSLLLSFPVKFVST